MRLLFQPAAGRRARDLGCAGVRRFGKARVGP